MRSKTLVLALLLQATSALWLRAEPEVTPAPASSYPVRKQTEDVVPKFSVNALLTTILVPPEKALEYLPGLQDPARIDETLQRLMEAVQKKEATLNGIAFVSCMDGQKTTSETIREERYPTEFDFEEAKGPKPEDEHSLFPDHNLSTPTAFDTRNVGLTFEFEPRVDEGGNYIRVSSVPQRVELIEYKDWEVFNAKGRGYSTKQQIFFTRKSVSEVRVRNGSHVLLGVHLLPAPVNQVELHLLKVTALPIP